MKLSFNRLGVSLRNNIAVLFTLTAFAAGLVVSPLANRSVRAADRDEAKSHQIEVPAPVQLSSVFSKVTKEVAPAVVNINTESTVHMTSFRRNMPSDEQDGFGGMFNRFFDSPQMPQQDYKQKSLGSGVIIDRDGYILTNNHVVDKADKIRVKIQDDPKQYDAKVIGTDKETDLAIIKIDAGHSLPYAKVGNSDGLNVGDWVLAIGSPFGLDETVTAGIISAKQRDLGGSPFQQFLQTDAAINPGNSGGPLVNMAGEVVGINTAIASNNGSNAGVGFALPSNVAANVYNQIVKSGKVTRGSIGVTFQPEPNEALLRSFGASHGVVVTSVQEDGPAAKAGIKQGDVIVSINGSAVKDSNDLISKVATLPVGEKATIGYIRDRKEQQTTLMIGDRGKVFASVLNPDEEQGSKESGAKPAKFGMSVQNVTPEMARQMGLKDTSGVLVAKVEPGSFAEDVGLRPGDVIKEMNQRPVAKVDDILKMESNLKAGSDVVFLVTRTAADRPVNLYVAGTLS